MSGMLQVDLEQLLATAGTFRGQQQVPTGLASTLDGARGADAGEPSLNGQIQTLVGQFLTALTDLATALGQDSTGLTRSAQSYRDVDAAGAALARQLASELGGTGLGGQ
jgi:hypothetical protein